MVLKDLLIDHCKEGGVKVDNLYDLATSLPITHINSSVNSIVSISFYEFEGNQEIENLKIVLIDVYWASTICQILGRLE
jgi:hypothetical protein